MLPGVEVARRRRMRAPAQRRELDSPSTYQFSSSNFPIEGRRSRGNNSSGSSNLAHHHHLHHHHHHHHYHHHVSRSASRNPAALSTQVRRLQDLLQEHRAAASQQQNSNLSFSSSSSSREGHSGTGFRSSRGSRVEEPRLSTLAMMLRGQAHERRLQGAAMEARDRLDERLRSAALPLRFSANSPRQALSSLMTSSTTQYETSVLFSDSDDNENFWSDDEEWEHAMREWLTAWVPSLEDRWQPDLFGGNHHHHHHHHHHRSAGVDPHLPLKSREGMSKDAIDAIKRETYGSKKASHSDLDQEDCSVCLDKFITGQKLLALPCNHKFHPNCLTPWLEGHEQCPYCRARITMGTSTLIQPQQQQQQQQQQRLSAAVVETETSSHTSYFVSWMSVVEQGMSRLSHGTS
ncbi:uncharacterized protein [Physcomitrium patens]|uniref:RING-type domain-containing protein n=1 Tax=Physcomitrium patens TaxID=3218 RepID=A0A7I4AGV2_PHYPA|nr:uncharacterized protein LOC112288861 isoform X2 [Physcomitrium patens]|eukprot:XP_024389304.1 uncharacterized protein LOC112288861 isoform X2 [Physcomitrella patens]